MFNFLDNNQELSPPPKKKTKHYCSYQSNSIFDMKSKQSRNMPKLDKLESALRWRGLLNHVPQPSRAGGWNSAAQKGKSMTEAPLQSTELWADHRTSRVAGEGSDGRGCFRVLPFNVIEGETPCISASFHPLITWMHPHTAEQHRHGFADGTTGGPLLQGGIRHEDARRKSLWGKATTSTSDPMVTKNKRSEDVNSTSVHVGVGLTWNTHTGVLWSINAECYNFFTDHTNTKVVKL